MATDRVFVALAAKLPRVADHLEAAREDILAFTRYTTRMDSTGPGVAVMAGAVMAGTVRVPRGG